MKTSCIAHPANERLLMIRKWQEIFCDGKHCPASVMSFLEYWHNWKLEADTHNKKSNDVAEQHGDRRLLSEDVIQFHTLQEISDGILNLYGVKAIAEALRFLEDEKGVISTHSNPNPRYSYDKKKYIKFYPDVCNEWIKNHYKSSLGILTESKMQKGIIDSVKRESREGENAVGQGEKGLAITEINNIEIINKLISAADDFLNDEANAFAESITDDMLESVVALLKAKGMPENRLVKESDLALVRQSVEKGATPDVFSAAYDLCIQVTAKTGSQFGISYLLKAVDSVMQKLASQHHATSGRGQSPPSSRLSTPAIEPVYESDFSQGQDWMGDLV